VDGRSPVSPFRFYSKNFEVNVKVLAENLLEQINAWLSNRQIQKAPTTHPFTLSIVIPAYNEEQRLLSPLIKTLDYCDATFSDYEIIVVDDGSTDNTSNLVLHLSAQHPAVKIITLPKNCGKGGALKAGVLAASGAMVLITDADGSTPIGEISRLLPYLQQGYEVIIGSRAVLDASVTVQAKGGRKFLGKAFNLVVNTLLIPEVADTQCGFKLFSKQAATYLFTKQRCAGFGFDTELLFIAQRSGILIKEVAINWHHVEGSKVSLARDSLRMFIDLLKHRWNHSSVSRDEYQRSRPEDSLPS
jgi:dolichyl-phosphate beta-glucosyltransferase